MLKKKKYFSKKNDEKRFSKDNNKHEKFFNPKADKPKVVGGIYVYHGKVTIQSLAEALGIKATDVLKDLFLKGKIFNINSVIDDENIAEVCIDNGFDFKKEIIVEPDEFENIQTKDDPKDLVERAPVVTIMGHVDHGKTTLIDTIRDSHIAAGEAGEITQEIGAYQKTINGKKITFLDTPGHEAFSAMRQRGAKITDIVILVVAADDGVMPQTVEAIDHAKAAGVPIVVAINKIDKAGADPEKVKRELGKYDLIPEEWGGTTIMKNISAKKNIGIDDLMANILLLADMKELKANPDKPASGTVIESTMDKKVGPKATLLVQNGTLKVGDYLVVGTFYCKVRRMTNEFNKQLKSAGPSSPVSIIGISGVPEAGDQFYSFETEQEARQIADKRSLKSANANATNANEGITIANVYDKIAEGALQVINLVIKADTEGTLQAIVESISKMSVVGVTTKILHAASGDITDGDVILASASKAIILAFDVQTNALVTEKAKDMHVEIRNYKIIYQLLDEVEAAMKGKLKPVMTEVIYGHAEVTATFKASKIGIIAGSNVKDGKMIRGDKIRVLRNNVKIFEGILTSLKREKDDTHEVLSGFDCGIVIDGYKDVQIGDVIECWGMEEAKKNNG